jgi:methionyl-tRNA formyltransferase
MDGAKEIRRGIVASCKPWGKEVFDFLRERFPLSVWDFVANKRELNALVREKPVDIILFIHWNWFVPLAITSKIECLCLHMTDLPFGRGGSPLQNLILLGRKKTKLTIFRMVDELDAGPIYTQREFGLQGSAHEIYQRMTEMSKVMFEEVIEMNTAPSPQEGEPFYFQRRKPADSVIPLNLNIDSVYDFIRMLDAPTYPQAFIIYGNFKISFHSASRKGNQLFASVSFEVLDGSNA